MPAPPLIFAAPLLAGGVHRGSMIGLMTVALGGVVATVVGLAMQETGSPDGAGGSGAHDLRGRAALSVDPHSVRASAPPGPKRHTLLLDNQVQALFSWPLSLDPPSTRVDVGRAALALVAFLVAYHLASGQSRRHLVIRTIGIAGILGVAIGLAHRILGVSKLYGLFDASPRSLLIGPFVNSNHTAEFSSSPPSPASPVRCSARRPSTGSDGWWERCSAPEERQQRCRAERCWP